MPNSVPACSRQFVSDEAFHVFLESELKRIHELAGIDGSVFCQGNQAPRIERFRSTKQAKNALGHRGSQIHHEIGNFHQSTLTVFLANQFYQPVVGTTAFANQINLEVLLNPVHVSNNRIGCADTIPQMNERKAPNPATHYWENSLSHQVDDLAKCGVGKAINLMKAQTNHLDLRFACKLLQKGFAVKFPSFHG